MPNRKKRKPKQRDRSFSFGDLVTFAEPHEASGAVFAKFLHYVNKAMRVGEHQRYVKTQTLEFVSPRAVVEEYFSGSYVSPTEKVPATFRTVYNYYYNYFYTLDELRLATETEQALLALTNLNTLNDRR